MEKAKRKANPQKAHQILTFILLGILGISLLLYLYPLMLPAGFSYKVYALVPLLSLPFAILHYRSFGITKWHIALIIACLGFSFLFFFMSPYSFCDIHLSKPINFTPFHYVRGCVFYFDLF